VHPPGVVDVVFCNVMSKHSIFVDFLYDRLKSMLFARPEKEESVKFKFFFNRWNIFDNKQETLTTKVTQVPVL
jgi:hypothetical protein